MTTHFLHNCEFSPSKILQHVSPQLVANSVITGGLVSDTMRPLDLSSYLLPQQHQQVRPSTLKFNLDGRYRRNIGFQFESLFFDS